MMHLQEKKYIHRWLMALACIMALTCGGCVTDDEPKGASLEVGDILPPFSVTMNYVTQSSSGSISIGSTSTVSTTSLAGKISVIVFFNTGCGDCQKELPVVQELWNEFSYNPFVEIFTIARDENEKDILNYWQKNGLTLPFSPQPNRDVYELFASSGIPRIYIADTRGEITAIFTDSPLASLQELSDEINALLSDMIIPYPL